jgi:hypothetical protein
MSADLYIHACPAGTIPEWVFKTFFRATLGSKYCNLKERFDRHADREAHKVMCGAPSIWVGEVSWLKASLTGCDDFVPNTVAAVSEAIGEDLPTIDEALIQQINETFDLPNDTGYELASKEDIVSWLESHKGEQAFVVNW